MSATSAKHSRLKSSTTHRIRNRRPSASVSDAKSSDQRWFGPSGTAIGARVPMARLRPPRRRTCRRSSRYSRRSFLWFGRKPFAGQQQAETAIAEPSPLPRQAAQPRSQSAVVRPDRPVADRAAIRAEE